MNCIISERLNLNNMAKFGNTACTERDRKINSEFISRLIIVVLLMFFSLPLAGQSTERYHLLVGTYTSSGRSEGIYVYEFDEATGVLTYKNVAKGVENPSYLTLSKNMKFVYAVNELGGGNGAVSSFSFNRVTGELTYLNSMSSGGNGPCYIATDTVGKYVYSGNYGGGSVSAIPLAADGSLGTSIQSIRHEGSGPTPNQESSHVHAAVPGPGERQLFVPDLGNDRVYIYSLNPERPNPLKPAGQEYVTFPPGSGPRHLTLHPNGKFAYVIHELSGEVAVLRLEDNGGLTPIQTISALPASQKGDTFGADAADIHISPDGKFLYISLRANYNELVHFEIGDTGQLTYRNRYSTLGEVPRNFAIAPSGNFLLVGNSGSDEIRIFKRNQRNGELVPTENKISVGSPVCLKFVAIGN